MKPLVVTPCEPVHGLNGRGSVTLPVVTKRAHFPSVPLAALVSCVLGMLVAPAASAQSTPDNSSAPASAAAPPEAPVPPEAAPAAPPRPRMGLVVPLTPPHQTVAKTGVKPGSKTTTKAGVKPDAKAPSVAASHYQNTRGTAKSKHYYSEVWGVDKLRANYTSSGNLIKFSYRVLQPKLAKTLGDHENAPELIGIRSNAVLHIPTMEKIGQLRQMSAAEANKDYWMVFSNKGNLVRPGDEVSVIIGNFRADGLIVE
jgi:hypothetical protein